MVDGNLISYRAFVDSKGQFGTELSKLDPSDIDKVFSKVDAVIVNKIISEVFYKVCELHEHLEREIQAVNKGEPW